MPSLMLLSLAAVAHPLGDRAATHTLSLLVLPDRIEVDYWVDVPDVFAGGEQGVLSALTVELASGLLLTVDGEVLSMRTRSPSPAPQRSSEHTLGFVFHLAADLREPLHPGERIELSTANLPLATNLFAHDVKLHPRLTVRETSVLARRPAAWPSWGPSLGLIARDDTLRWRRDEEGRRAWVVLGRPEPWWWGPATGSDSEPVRAASALEPRAADLLRPDVSSPVAAIGALLAALGAGLCVGREQAKRAVAGALPGILLCAVPGGGDGLIELTAGLLSLAAALAGQRALAAGVAAAALAASPRTLLLGIVIWGAFGAASLARQGSSRLLALALALLWLWLLLRALAA